MEESGFPLRATGSQAWKAGRKDDKGRTNRYDLVEQVAMDNASEDVPRRRKF